MFLASRGCGTRCREILASLLKRCGNKFRHGGKVVEQLGLSCGNRCGETWPGLWQKLRKVVFTRSKFRKNTLEATPRKVFPQVRPSFSTTFSAAARNFSTTFSQQRPVVPQLFPQRRAFFPQLFPHRLTLFHNFFPQRPAFFPQLFPQRVDVVSTTFPAVTRSCATTFSAATGTCSTMFSRSTMSFAPLVGTNKKPAAVEKTAGGRGKSSRWAWRNQLAGVEKAAGGRGKISPWAWKNPAASVEKLGPSNPNPRLEMPRCCLYYGV